MEKFRLKFKNTQDTFTVLTHWTMNGQEMFLLSHDATGELSMASKDLIIAKYRREG